MSFAKGIISPPTPYQEWKYFLDDNRDVFIGALGLFLTFIYYFFAWFMTGRDPAKGTIIPTWEAPDGLSAAEVRFVDRMAFDRKIMAVQLLQMAVKGYIKIHDVAGKYKIEKIKDAESPEEQRILDYLSDGGELFEFSNENHTAVSNAIAEIKQSVQSKHLKRSFFSNSIFVLPAVLLMGLTFFFELQSQNFAAEDLLNAGNLLIFFLFVLMHFVFKYLLKAPTFAGRKLMDKIEGFKMYLNTAERERIKAMQPADTPEIFEKFLPYAVALGVENAWSERFASVFSKLEEQGRPYRPVWYGGSYRDFGSHGFNASSFSSSLSNSFSNAISASATPPGSSSGSSFGGGGGGSSGGGGGGGGGGGW